MFKTSRKVQTFCFLLGTALAQCLRAVLHIGRSLVRSQLVSMDFYIDMKSFRSHYGLGVDWASNRNEYQEYFLRVKSGRCVRLTTLPLPCAVVMKSGNLNFLEPSGPVKGLIYLLPFFVSDYANCRGMEMCRSFGVSRRTFAGRESRAMVVFRPVPWAKP
jgi:hypothetical protein